MNEANDHFETSQKVQPPQDQLPPPHKNYSQKIMLRVFFSVVIAVVCIGVGYYLGSVNNDNPELNNQVNNPSTGNQNQDTSKTTSLTQKDSLDSSIGSQETKLYTWNEIITSNLQFSPSYIEMYKSEKQQYLSCLNIEGQLSFQMLEPTIKDKPDIVEGLKVIEDYVYTRQFIDEKGNPLEPTKSKYKIEYTNICASDGTYYVLFLTTQQINLTSKLIKHVNAAGGWLGDSNLAVIKEGNTKIYETFPTTAKLIDLPQEGNDPVLMRFMAYYHCSRVPLLTEKHLFISCSGNMYTMNLNDGAFEELAICGSRLKDGSYMSGDVLCVDKTGSEYLLKRAN